jgi:hypothetical protein
LAVARGAARYVPQILDRGAQSVARDTARCASHIALAVASLCIAGPLSWYPGRCPLGCASARFYGKKGAVRKVSSARQHPATIADNAKALGSLLARLAGSRDASCSTGRGGRAYVMRVADSARVTYAAATPAVRKVSGARQKHCDKSLATRKR